jgi:hypothetical protein
MFTLASLPVRNPAATAPANDASEQSATLDQFRALNKPPEVGAPDVQA